ncbi:MAG: response regulator [Nitrospirae bacterium]|nr:response regulator [Nitrospirota bacterium]
MLRRQGRRPRVTSREVKGTGRPAIYAGEESVKKVLLMDDEEIILRVSCRMLETLGYKVEIASEGEEAVGKYTSAMKAGEPFDAVILDLTVKGGTGGREAIRKMIETDPEVRAILSSGYVDDPGTEDYRALGFKASLAKPYQIEELDRTLSLVMRSDGD